MKKDYADFNALSKEYAQARTGYPDELFSYLQSFLKDKKNRIVDLGCGTGISPRQLATPEISIIGCDKAFAMIAEAQKQFHKNIHYIVGEAEQLPFPTQLFDAVTCFSSFHWFATKTAGAEIKRVLKKEGFLFIINKFEEKDFLYDFEKIIEQKINLALPNPHKDYHPLDFVQSCGFHDVQEILFQAQERYSLEKALLYLQSRSYWNLVPKEKQMEVLAACKKTFQEKYPVKQALVRDLKIRVVSGRA